MHFSEKQFEEKGQMTNIFTRVTCTPAIRAFLLYGTEKNHNDCAMAKYSKKAQDFVERAMKKKKQGSLKSGTGKKVTGRKQAIAIGLSEARKAGAKVPRKGTAGSGPKNSGK